MLDLTMFEVFPMLYSERLVLRTLKEQDRDALFELFSSPAVTRYHGTSTFVDIEQVDDFLYLMHSRYQQKTGIRWAVVLKDTGEMIGTVGINSIVQHRIVIGYDLQERFWGHGYMPEAVQAVTDYAFSMGIHRIQAMVIPENHGSVRVLQKLGFQEEGLLRGWYLWEGRYWDMLSFSLLKTDVQIEKV